MNPPPTVREWLIEHRLVVTHRDFIEAWARENDLAVDWADPLCPVITSVHLV